MSARNSLRLTAAAGTVAALVLPLGAAVATSPGARTAGESVTSAITTTAAPRAAARRLNAVPGRYKGHFYTGEGKRLESFTFRVSKNGKKLKKFRSPISVICSYYPPTVEVHPMGFPTTTINKRHKFKKVWKPNEDSRIVLNGKFKGKRLVSGKLDYTVGICVRVGYMKAKRVGK